MTWTINMSGHDNLAGEEKAAIEAEIIALAAALAADIAALEGAVVSTATIYTNTGPSETGGQISLLPKK